VSNTGAARDGVQRLFDLLGRSFRGDASAALFEKESVALLSDLRI